jgi:putative transposase
MHIMLGVSKIMLGKIEGHKRTTSHNNGKANAMINNFWSFNHIIRRFREKAEECGIKIVEVSEYNTSSRCPKCHSENITTKGRLFKCLNCGIRGE